MESASSVKDSSLNSFLGCSRSVSYTHLDVYKRQGHSMGSLIARAYLKKLDFTLDGLIISGCPVYVPGCKMGQSIVKFLEAFKGCLLYTSRCV